MGRSDSINGRGSPNALVVCAHACRLKQRPDIGAPVTASPAGKLRFEIGQPDTIGTAVSLEYNGMSALVIAAEDDELGTEL